MSDERTGAARVASTAALVAGVAWSVGALLYAISPVRANASGSEIAAFVASAVLPPLLAAAWSRSQWSETRWADWALAAAALLLLAALLISPVIALLPWPNLSFMALGPTIVCLAWMRPGPILTGAAFPVAFMLAVFLGVGINPLAFVVLLPASAVVGLAWLPMAWREASVYWTARMSG